MLNISLVEDESVYLDKVERILISTLNSKQCNFSLSKYHSAEELLNDKNSKYIDLAFLDIQLINMNGIELSKKLYSFNKRIIVVFLTSYDIFARDAFGLNVFRYILKADIDNFLPKVIIELLELLSINRNELTFRSNNIDYLIKIGNIICFTFEGRNIHLHTNDKILKLSPNITIKDIYNKLDPNKFVCPNSGTIINIDYIDFITTISLKLKIINMNISISRGRYKDIYKIFNRNLLNGDIL